MAISARRGTRAAASTSPTPTTADRARQFALAGLDGAAAEADVDALHAGRVLVLVHTAAIRKDEVRALLDAVPVA
jgi:hypothetical protein